jgi:uncharacterized protein YaiE (UPF0345 family)
MSRTTGTDVNAGSAVNAERKDMTGMDASAGYAIKSATKGTIGTVVNARYAIKTATKDINGRGVSVKNAGNMPITRYITGSSVSMASSMLPV